MILTDCSNREDAELDELEESHSAFPLLSILSQLRLQTCFYLLVQLSSSPGLGDSYQIFNPDLKPHPAGRFELGD
jgi:hypothetical protein